MGSCFSKRRQSVSDHALPEKGHKVVGPVKPPISVVAPSKVSKEASLGFDEAVQKLQSEREAHRRGLSVRDGLEQLSETGKGPPRLFQASHPTVDESTMVLTPTEVLLLNGSNTAKISLAPSVSSMEQKGNVEKIEQEITHCDETSANLDLHSSPENREAWETICDSSKRGELTKKLDTTTVKLDRTVDKSAPEATPNAVGRLTNRSNANDSTLGSKMKGSLKPAVAAQDLHKTDEVERSLFSGHPHDVVVLQDSAPGLPTKPSPHDWGNASKDSTLGNASWRPQEFSKTTEIEHDETDRKLGGDIANSEVSLQGSQLVQEGKEHHSEKVETTDASFFCRDEVEVAGQSTQEFEINSTSSSGPSGKVEVVGQSFQEADKSEVNHITGLEEVSLVEREEHKGPGKPDEQVFSHSSDENEVFLCKTELLHAIGDIYTNQEDGFVACQANRTCEQRMPNGLQEHVLPKELIMSSRSQHFIILENWPTPNSNSHQRREGVEEDATSEEICIARQMGFSWEDEEEETSESDSETFEFQHTADYDQRDIERTEQLQERVVVEQTNKRASSERKRGWDLFEYEESSLKRGKTTAKPELASEDSGLIDLRLGRDDQKHGVCKNMQQMQQRKSEDDTDGSRVRSELLPAVSNEHALILAGSNTEELDFVPSRSFLVDMPISSTKHRASAAAPTTAHDSPLRFNSYHQQQEASALSIEDIMHLLEKDELDEEDLLSMLINAKSSCQASDVASESSFEFKIRSADSTPHSTPSTPMLSAGSTPRRISQLNPMALTPEEIAEIWGVFESRQTLASY